MFMKIGKAQEGILFFIIVVPIFLVLIIMSILFFSRESRHNRLVLEYEAGRLAVDLLESTSTNPPPDLPTLRPDVLGFGVYGAGGRAAFRVGTAPETLALPPLETDRPLFRYRDSRLVMVRPLGFPASTMRGMGRGMMRGPSQPDMPFRRDGANREDRSPVIPDPGRMPQAVQAGRLLYLEIDINEWISRQRTLQWSFVVIPVSLLMVLTGVVLLYRKNREYRLREEKTLQLVQLGEAARTLTHEIKNPLGAIKIQTATLKKVTPAEYHKNLTVISEEVDRLNHLVDRVGDFLKKPEGDPEPIDLDEFIREMIRRFSEEIIYTPPDTPVLVRFDRHRLRTVIENLIKNAAESMDTQDRRVEIVVTSPRGHAEIRVLDRGAGLPDNAGERIFDPFYTTKTKGSGIGLAVSKRFVEARGGNLRLRPREGGGTEASVILPREDKT
jgi:signal transduction histidine kinase